MGVAGSGKTTIGRLLAGELGWPFHDADEFHPQMNIEKMANGIPLTDEDRLPWLERLNSLLRDASKCDTSIVLACSALSRAYRDIVAANVSDFHTVYLKGDYQLIQQRILQRKDHYMKQGMLRSQFDALEEPRNVLTVDIARDPGSIVQEIRSALSI